MMVLADVKTQKYINGLLRTSHPTDVIALDDIESCYALKSLWWGPDNEDGTKERIPSDILFANTVPLKDCLIDCSAYVEEDEAIWCRVCVFGGYENAPARQHENRMVGACVITLNNRTRLVNVVVPMWIRPGVNGIEVAFVYFQNESREMHELNFKSQKSQDEMMAVISDCMSIWYGIQIALLHPTIKYVFRNPQRADIANYLNSKPHKGKRKPVRYVKVHHISGEQLDSKMYVGSGDHRFVRKTMKWWVIGHWRHYRNGKVVFIKGYWKGPLRNTQIPVEPREREIVTDGISVDNSTESVHN